MRLGVCQVRGFSPDVAMLELVVAALDHAGVGSDHPLSTAGWREKSPPTSSLPALTRISTSTSPLL